MSNQKTTIADLVKQASARVNLEDNSLLKTAHEQGIADAERVTKVASITGDIMGNQAYDTFHYRLSASLGFDPEEEIVKQASIADMIDTAVYASLEKIAETYSPQSGGANLVSTQQASADQLREAGKAHAELAVQAANDAIASADQGDPNTAAQSMATAAENMTLARQAHEVVADPELEAYVAQASQAVGSAAQAIQGVA